MRREMELTAPPFYSKPYRDISALMQIASDLCRRIVMLQNIIFRRYIVRISARLPDILIFVVSSVSPGEYWANKVAYTKTGHGNLFLSLHLSMFDD
jgi:hypothetical protein